MIQASALTDIGRKRPVNQDFVFSAAEPIGALPDLFLLADGMGGHQAGEYASKFLVEKMTGFIRRTREGEAGRILQNALSMANTMLLERSHTDKSLAGMGTTAVACVIEDDRMTVVNVGDSRLYLVRDGIRQITKDHSYVEELIEQGLMQRGSAEYRKNKNLITRAVGIDEVLLVDTFEERLLDGDYVLLCSDGLTNMVPDDDLLCIITGKGGLSYKAQALVDLANANGGSDNIAVILIRYTKGGEQHA